MMDEYYPIIDENINPCRGCPDYEYPDGCKSNGGCGIHTYADKIRAMTDEELAEFLNKNRGGCRATITETYVCNFFGDCEACWLDWLKKPGESEIN